MGISKLFKGKGKTAARSGSPPPAETPDVTPAAPQFSPEEIKEAMIEAMRTVYDPEIPVNIYDMGLVYDIDMDPANRVMIHMTLTSPGCPVAGSLVHEIEQKVRDVPGVKDVFVELVWDPPWDPDRMTDAAKLQLGMF
jgi:FeS assembly SUF system protein